MEIGGNPAKLAFSFPGKVGAKSGNGGFGRVLDFFRELFLKQEGSLSSKSNFEFDDIGCNLGHKPIQS